MKIELSKLQTKAKESMLNILNNNNNNKYLSLSAAPGSGKTTLIIKTLQTFFSDIFIKEDFSTTDNDGNTVFFFKGKNKDILTENIRLDVIKKYTEFSNQDKKGLILSFNKKITEEAYKKASETKIDVIEQDSLKSKYLIKDDFMSKNLDISTYHSFMLRASKHIIEKYNFFPDYTKGQFYKSDIALVLETIKPNYNELDVDVLTKIVNEYHNSPHNLIGFLKDKDIKSDALPSYSKFLKSLIDNIYKKMNLQEITMPHIMYYKYSYDKAIKDPDFLKSMFSDDSGKPYSFVIVDEAQDSDLMIFNLITKINTQSIFVGDDLQNIFSFKGTFNIFDKLNNEFKEQTDFLPLNQSFRFGKSIAGIVSKIPNTLNSVIFKENVEVSGTKKTDALISKPLNIDNVKNFSLNNLAEKNKTTAIITRTNKRAFEIFMYLKSHPELSKMIKIDSSIKTKANEFLKKGISSIKDKVLKQQLIDIFNGENVSVIDIANNKEAQELLQNSEYSFILKITNEDILDSVKSRQSSKANIIITTTHQSKGLEYDNVIIADDYIKKNKEEQILELLFDDIEFKNNEFSKEEVNVIYTVASRAKESLLFMESTLFDVLKTDIENIASNFNDKDLENKIINQINYIYKDTYELELSEDLVINNTTEDINLFNYR